MPLAEHCFDEGSLAWDYGNLKRAFRLLLKGAKAGDASCQQNIGYFYDEGILVRKNSSKAIYWYKKSAAHGSSSAAYNLGMLFKRKGLRNKARIWFAISLSLGEVDAASEIELLIKGHRAVPAEIAPK